MSKASRRITNLAIAGVVSISLSSCVKQLWQETYPGPDGFFSEAIDLIEDTTNNIAILGRTRTTDSNDTLYIAKYNAHGEFLWDYKDAGFIQLHYPNRHLIESDQHNNTFYSGISLQNQVRIGLINPAGEALWTKTIQSQSSGLVSFFDLALTNNQEYLAFTHTNGLEAYNIDGQIQWSFNPWHDANDSTLATTQPFPLGEIAVSEQGYIFLNTGSKVFKLNPQGEQLATITAEQLSLEYIGDIETSHSHLAVMGGEQGFTRIQVLNHDLAIEYGHVLTTENAYGSLAFRDDQHLCYAANDINQSVLISGMLNEHGIVWQNNDLRRLYLKELVNLQVDDKHCLITQVEADDLENIKTYTHYTDNTGSISKSAMLQDFFAAKSLVSKQYLYTIGITGEYDGSITEATLTKQQIQ
ncbi:MAG: hypothetical protein MI796_01455 [Enterobacterales bacterium]|nr:hypothetical protein [Enterobacterales bacterium]